MKVKIKTWEAMEKKFGLDVDGDINCEAFFTKNMEDKMPDNRIINLVHWIGNCGFWDDTGWKITEDMIDQIIEV